MCGNAGDSLEVYSVERFGYLIPEYTSFNHYQSALVPSCHAGFYTRAFENAGHNWSQIEKFMAQNEIEMRSK